MSDIFSNMMNQYSTANEDSFDDGYKKYDLKNYFTTHLEKGVNSDDIVIRLLPPIEGHPTPFVTLWGHKKQIGDSWKTFPCLKHEKDEPCPFCEAKDLLLASGVESDKELAKDYRAKKMYVVKLIDRSKEEDGIKFWRFNHDFRGTGVLDKIMKAIKAAKHDVSDPITGRDLIVSLARDQKRPNIVNVQAVNCELEVKPLSDNEETMREWLDDKSTWEDVYAVRDYEYLSIIVTGGTPKYDKDKECWVNKDEMEDRNDSDTSGQLEAELTMGNKKETVAKATATPQTSNVSEQVTSNVTDDDFEDDDLPF